MLESSDDFKKFTQEVAKIENEEYKQELTKFMQNNYRVDLTKMSKGKAVKMAKETDEERWKRLSAQEKFEEATADLPLAMIFFVFRWGLYIFVILFCLQAAGIMKQEVIPPTWIEAFLKLLNGKGVLPKTVGNILDQAVEIGIP